MAERLKWLRKEKARITLEELAKKVGISRATAQRYEAGIITNIPSDKIELLAEALETTPGFIMGWENDPEKYRLDNRFGRLLRKERISSGMGKAEFAKHIGITEEALEKYETGAAIPGINVALPIAIQLGISIDQYDPMESQKPKNDNEEILRLFSQLSSRSKVKALAYLQGLKDNEDNS
jgi:transcriptional regulator with XRE-family HTH domain